MLAHSLPVYFHHTDKIYIAGNRSSSSRMSDDDSVTRSPGPSAIHQSTPSSAVNNNAAGSNTGLVWYCGCLQCRHKTRGWCSRSTWFRHEEGREAQIRDGQIPAPDPSYPVPRKRKNKTQIGSATKRICPSSSNCSGKATAASIAPQLSSIEEENSESVLESPNMDWSVQGSGNYLSGEPSVSSIPTSLQTVSDLAFSSYSDAFPFP